MGVALATRRKQGRRPLRSVLHNVVVGAGVVFCLSPWASPPLALGLGIVLALSGLATAGPWAKRASKVLIQVGVVLLGFKMNLAEVLRAGATGIVFAAGTIVATFAAGAALGRLLRVDPKVTTLLSSGTAICGGSAIAAVGSVIRASGAQMGVALATVFVLNGAALYLFPPMGRWLAMSQEQFGTWAAVAIHDVSSVVGAGMEYGTEATEVATAVKLSRVLWIVPIAFIAARAHREPEGEGAAAARVPVPWFVGLFLLAAGVRTAVPELTERAPGIGRFIGEDLLPALAAGAKVAMTVALFLIGAGLSRAALKSAGWRAMALGIALWVLISTVALAVVLATVE